MSRLPSGGFSPRQVDEMELWEIAAILDSYAPREVDPFADDPTGEGVAMTEDEFQRQSMAIIRQRLAAAEAAAEASASESGEPPTMTP